MQIFLQAVKTSWLCSRPSALIKRPELIQHLLRDWEQCFRFREMHLLGGKPTTHLKRVFLWTTYAAGRATWHFITMKAKQPAQWRHRRSRSGVIRTFKQLMRIPCAPPAECVFQVQAQIKEQMVHFTAPVWWKVLASLQMGCFGACSFTGGAPHALFHRGSTPFMVMQWIYTGI